MLLLAAAFGVLVTAHVALILGLASRPPRWRALVALVLPPLAAYWGWQEQRRLASATWFVSLVAYAVALFMAAR